MVKYLFDNAHEVVVDRFTALEQRYDPVTVDRLEEFGVPEGARCLEVGAGGGSIARWLADRVGTSGSVVATDIDVSRTTGGPANLEIRKHDIVSGDLPESEFDVVHARLVLIHLPERAGVLDRILRALRPGGRLLLDEFDTTWTPVLTAPDPASARLYTKVVGAVHRVLELGGLEQAWGRNAAAAMTAAGYADVDVRGYCEAWRGGSAGCALHAANARQLEDEIVAHGLATSADVDQFTALMHDPDLTVASYLMLSTWGTRPTP